MGERAKMLLNEHSALNLLYKDIKHKSLNLDKFYNSDLKVMIKAAEQEIERLNNIIDEIEKFVSVGTYIEQDAHLKTFGVNENFIRGEAILKKIQELKDSDSNVS